jgi:SAM-dependent methyltransferase
MSSAERHYRGEQGRNYHEKKRAVPESAVPWVARLRAEKIQPFVQAGDTVFEYGAGFGWNLLELWCARKLAYDISDVVKDSTSSIEWMKEIESVPSGSADVVICHHTLEHVVNPPQVLETLGRILKEAGTLLLYVPFEKERRYRYFNPAEPNHHLYSWNVQTLGNLVTECGWKVQSAKIGLFGYDRLAAKLALKLRFSENGFRAIRAIGHLVRPAAEVRIVAAKA